MYETWICFQIPDLLNLEKRAIFPSYLTNKIKVVLAGLPNSSRGLQSESPERRLQSYAFGQGNIQFILSQHFWTASHPVYSLLWIKRTTSRTECLRSLGA